jgi:hypothetical protein
MNKGIAAALATMKGMKIEGKITNRGITKSTELKMTGKPAGPMAGQMSQIQNSMGLSVLPEQAVGVGAKWQVERQVKHSGLSMNQTETYEILSIAGDVVTIQTTSTQHAGNQKMSNPAMPNLKMDVSKIEGKGTGKMVMDLGKVSPISGEMETESESVMSMNMGGQKRDITSKQTMKLKLESK